jgi:hypothetical protein
MSLPVSSLIEMPILQELSATGGSDDVRYLYERLIDYFPQINASETSEIKNGTNKNWRKSVQKPVNLSTKKTYSKEPTVYGR